MEVLKDKPKVSVIIPTVNAWEELDLAIASIKQNSDLPIEFLIVIDPDMNTGKVNPDIIKVCKKHNIKPYINTENLGPYGNWNKGADNATTEWLIFATDDQYFAPHWDSELLKVWQPKRFVVGRLVEPGIIPVWRTNVQKDFGVLPSEFKEKAFISWCSERKERGFSKDGFFIPMLQNKKDYDALGGYPTLGKFGTSTAVSNDDLYIKTALKKGYEFGTAEESYSYHFQASSWKKKTLTPKISAIVLTKNEEVDLGKCLKSLQVLTSDIHVVDSGSTDKTLSIAKEYKATIHSRQFDNFAAQRNFALGKVTTSNWVLFLDADEELEKGLAQELAFFSKDIYLDGVEVRRKNFIFGKWVQHSDWYPDFRLVFVRPKMVTFEGEVHERIKYVKGNGTTAKTSHHILHHNYDTVAEFVVKNLVDYPKLYANSLNETGIKFSATEMVGKSLAEFMRRFFLTEGWRDGMNGFVLAMMMGVQNILAYIYLWELQGKRADLTTDETQALFRSLRGRGTELSYWLTTMAIESSAGFARYFHRAQRKAIKLINHL
ncbi:MAG: glycosyltransferase [bacterium]